MHELPITQNILNIALETAQRAGALRITTVDLVIGDLSSIVDDSVQFYFTILSQDTIAAGAILHIRRDPATATCQACGHAVNVSVPLAPCCPTCGSAQLRITGGRQFFVESIEVEHENPRYPGNNGRK